MNSKQIDTGLLINEWQLGQQLNTAVHNGTRDKFNLLLSLLSDDARDFAQFALPEENTAILEKADLRAAFSLGQAQPLVNKGMSAQQAQLLNGELHANNLSSVRLQLLLNNEALVSRCETSLFPSELTDNLTFLSQQRLAASVASTELSAADEMTGVNHELMEQYQAMDFDNKPVKLTYM